MNKLKKQDVPQSHVIEHAKIVAECIAKQRNFIVEILTEFESKVVAKDEIDRVLDLLHSLHENETYFVHKKVSKVATFLPLNLPFYSLFLFALIPSYQSEIVVVRAPQLLHSALNKLAKAISLDKLYPNTHIKDVDRNTFVEDECKTSAVVVFTGKYNNFLKIKDRLSEETLLLYNGVGHNPVVVTPDADISLAAEKVAFLKTFNNGQDCAGADIVLVHKDIINTFIGELKKYLVNVKVGPSYKDEFIVGPLAESSSLLSTAEMFDRIQNSRGKIVYGGTLDFKNNIVDPTVCHCHIKNFRNYKELYSPVILVSEYDSDNERAVYFEDQENRYVQKQMYVSVFGTSNYVTDNVLGTIVLKDLIIHDVERGTEEYGGYSHGASLVSKSGITISKPILIPREIYHYILCPAENYSKFATKKKSSVESIQDLVSNDFINTVTRVFGSNLKFAFIFGSFARGRGKNYSDIDTFICIDERKQEQIDEYIDWIFSVSEIFGKIPDFTYPAEIMTLEELRGALNVFPTITLSSSRNNSEIYDSMLWTHALSHAKLATIYPENIPEEWLSLFQANSKRLLKTYLSDQSFKDVNHEKREMLLKNLLAEKDILDLLKEIPFDIEYRYTESVMQALLKRNFFGRKMFQENDKITRPSNAFRFGPA